MCGTDEETSTMFKDLKAPDCSCELKDGVDPCDPIFDGAFQFGLDG